jgi:hypothetical protein
MDITAALAAQRQLFQVNLGMAVLRAQHQAQQTLVSLLAESVQAVATVNPGHLGQSIDTQV